MKTHSLTEPNGAITLVDIANRCGVSRSAASYALQGDNKKVSDETRRRVLAAAREMGYDPSRNQAARRMAMKKNGTLARNQSVCIAFPPNFGSATYYTRILEGVLDVMAEHSYGLHFSILGELSDALPAVFARGEVDGLLTVASSDWFSLWMERLRAEPNFGQRPIVALIDPVESCLCVRADDYRAGYSVAAHLLDLGHEYVLHDFQPAAMVEFGAVMTPDSPPSRRLQGLQQAFRDRGIDPETHVIASDMPHIDAEIGEKGSRLLQSLREHSEITAVCAPNDYTAVRVYGVLREAGLRVPDDLSLISFDDTDAIVADGGWNILTTVRMPLREFGQESAHLIIRAIDDDVKNIQNIVLSTELIVRKSTAPPKRRE